MDQTPLPSNVSFVAWRDSYRFAGFAWFVFRDLFQKRGGAEGEDEEDRESDEIFFSAAPEELEEEEFLEALELAEVEEGNLLCVGSF